MASKKIYFIIALAFTAAAHAGGTPCQERYEKPGFFAKELTAFHKQKEVHDKLNKKAGTKGCICGACSPFEPVDSNERKICRCPTCSFKRAREALLKLAGRPKDNNSTELYEYFEKILERKDYYKPLEYKH